jgi:hypothetical protein
MQKKSTRKERMWGLAFCAQVVGLLDGIAVAERADIVEVILLLPIKTAQSNILL